jgi:hypothetical protein
MKSWFIDALTKIVRRALSLERGFAGAFGDVWRERMNPRFLSPKKERGRLMVVLFAF